MAPCFYISGWYKLNTKNFFIVVVLMTFLLAGCSGEESNDGTLNEVTSQPVIDSPASDFVDSNTENVRLNLWFDQKFEEQLDFSPEFRTRLGDKTDYDRFNDYSAAQQDKVLQWRRDSVAELESEFDYNVLTEDGKLSWDMWAFSLDQAESGVAFRNHGYIFGRGGPHTQFPTFLINYHRVDNKEDLDAYLSRLRDIDRAIGELLDRAKVTSASGVRQPGFAYEFAVTEIGRVTSGVPFNNNDTTPNSALWADIKGKIDNLLATDLIAEEEAQSYYQAARDILSGEVLAAYNKVLAWLEEDKQFSSSEPQGVWALPNGEDFYNYRLSLMTTLDYNAEEIHEIGLSEVARLRGEMEKIKTAVGFEDDLQEFFSFMRESEQFYYSNDDDGRSAYLENNYAYLDFINAKIPEYFGRLPKADLEIRRVEPYREQPGAAQHYMSGTPDGSRPGVYYSHMIDMANLPIYQIEDVLYHEGIPGHHMQISIQQELTDVPRFRTQYRTTAYTEGWGLYAEWLAKEMGGFEDPYSDFGRLSGEMWRAIRLVVDTGIHAKRWSLDQAVDFFQQNSSQPEGTILSEIQRYFTGPGQATAYKMGMIKFQEFRQLAEEQMDDSFNIREFHDVVLGAGALPMPMVEARVQRWIADKLGGEL